MDEKKQQPDKKSQKSDDLPENGSEGTETYMPSIKHFLVHNPSGKVEVSRHVKPGVISYGYDSECVTPNDIKFILETTAKSLELDDLDDSVKFIMDPMVDKKRMKIWLDIRNRTNIEIGIMQLWRYR